jgi:hypothetical protein
MAGARAGLYAGPVFEAFRRAIDAYEPERPERLQAAYFRRAEPEELIWDEIEALWDAIAERDDWAPLYAKLARVGEAREAWGIAEA